MIAFYSRVGSSSEIFIVDANGGQPRQLTSDAFSNFYPRWSRDGRWIYFASKRTGEQQVWKIPPGGGTPVQVTYHGGFAGLESPDGRWLYYTKTDTQVASLWRMPVDGGEEFQVLTSVHNFNYEVVDDGIYYMTKADHRRRIEFFGFQLKTARTLAEVGDGYVGFSVSPDRNSILFTQNAPPITQLRLVDNLK